MQLFIIFTICSALMAHTALAGPIGRYPMIRRHNAQEGDAPLYTNTSSIETPASTSTTPEELLFIPPVTASISEPFSSVVTSSRSFQHVTSDVIPTSTAGATDAVPTTSVISAIPTSEEFAVSSISAPTSTISSYAVSTSSIAISTDPVITSVVATGSTSDAVVTPSTSAVEPIVNTTSAAQIAPTSELAATSQPIETSQAVTASGYTTAIPEPISATSSSATPSTSSTPVTDNKAQNRQLAINQNKIYAALTETSKCDPADPSALNACIGGAFAQCGATGTYTTVTQCASPLKCFALPLELSAGISVACTTTDDAALRMGMTAAELESALGGGSAGDVSSSAAPIPTVTSSVVDTTTSAASSAPQPTTPTSAVGGTSSVVTPTPTTTSAAVSTTNLGQEPVIPLPTISSSQVPTTATPSSTGIVVPTSLPPQEPVLPLPTHIKLPSSSAPVPTVTSAAPGNQAPVVTPIPIGDRLPVTTIHG